MTCQALAVAGLCFLMSFDPEASAGVFAMAGALSNSGGFSKYDNWLFDKMQRYDTPNEVVLLLTPRQRRSEVATVYWPGIMESEAPAEMHGRVGLIVVDAPEYSMLPTRILDFCFDALVPGGTVLVTNGRHVVIAFKKEEFKQGV